MSAIFKFGVPAKSLIFGVKLLSYLNENLKNGIKTKYSINVDVINTVKTQNKLIRVRVRFRVGVRVRVRFRVRVGFSVRVRVGLGLGLGLGFFNPTLTQPKP